MNSVHDRNKRLIARYRAALYDLEPTKLLTVMKEVFSEDCIFHMCSPFGDIIGPEAYYEAVFCPMLTAMPDLERRDYIDVAGDSKGVDWVGSCGYWIGVFEQPWLDIPPTCHPIAMRYHEFFKVESGKVVEFQGIWDMVHFMMQADAWPLAPSLGMDWVGPAPALQNGLQAGDRDEAMAKASCDLILDMLTHMNRYPSQGTRDVMEMERFWHPKMTWYGPAGIGTNRRISGFTNWHSIPFLKALPDRGDTTGLDDHFFGDGHYAACTGWPNMQMTISGDGWMGLPPVGKKLTMKSLDFWREEKGLIRENWVLIDLLDIYDQLGVDVFSRMRERTVARQQVRPAL